MEKKGETKIDYKSDPKYVLVDLNIPPTFINAKLGKSARQDYVVPEARVFEIAPILTPQECRALIELTESLGYKDIGKIMAANN